MDYDTKSSLLLVRAPYSIFMRMGRPKENFTGFVNAENKMHSRTAPKTLPLRPIKWITEAKEDEGKDEYSLSLFFDILNE